jgi:predicted PurR-regulated permease PerM
MARTYTARDHRKAIVFLSLLMAVTLVLTFFIGLPFLRAIAYAVIMATVFHPLYRYLLKKTRTPNRAALVSALIIFLLIVLPVAFLLNIAAIQAAAIAHSIAARSAVEGGFVPFLVHLADKPIAFLGRFVDVSSFNPQEQISENARSFGVKLLPTAASWVANIFGVVANTILALIACYFLLRDSERILHKLGEMLPVSDEHANRLIATVKNTIVANVQGVFAVGAAQGLATGIALFAVGVSPAVLLGIVAALCSIVPLVGTGLVWGPAAIYLIATGHLLKGVILLGIGAGGIAMLDNIIRPLVVSTRMQANGLVLMLSMLGGVQAFGFLGLFVGPTVIALIVAVGTMLAEEVKESRSQEASVSS